MKTSADHFCTKRAAREKRGKGIKDVESCLAGLDGLTPASIYEAHKLQESGNTIGKTVIRYL